MDHLGEIAKRLAEIDRLLDNENRKPSSEQFALLKERDRLRAQATQFTPKPFADESDDELIAELAALRKVRKTNLRASTGFVTSKGGGNQGPSSGAWVELSSRAAKASGVDQLTQRIAALESELTSRGIKT